MSHGEDPAALVDAGLMRAVQVMASCAPDGTVHDIGDVRLGLTGFDHPALNLVFAAAPVEDPTGDLATAIHAADGAGDRYSVLLRDPSPATVAWLDEEGFATAGPTEPGMLLRLDAPPVVPPELNVQPVEDAADLELFHSIFCEVFGLPIEAARAAFGSRSLEQPGLRNLLGAHGTMPCAAATAMTVGDTVAVFNVSVLIDHRRLGFGTAISWAAIADGYARGARYAILTASEDGLPVYERMGFRTVCRYHGFTRP